MNWNNWSVGSTVLVAVLASGCVTKGTYEKLESEKNQEIAQLQTQRDTLQNQRTELTGQISDLGTQKSELEQQQADLQKQIAALEEQKTELLASSEQNQTQYDTLVANLKDEVEKGQLQVRQFKNMLTVDVAEQLFFDSGQATLKAEGKDVLGKVGETLKGYDDKVIRVVGHTDNVPIAGALQKIYPSNWELSVARATSVVRYLQQVGVAPERMIASGRAEYAPVAENDDAKGRQKNRRIEITLVDRTLAQEISTAAK